MNLFYLDENVNKCAEFHVDLHVGKMILEAAQILCDVRHSIGYKAPYKIYNPNHPTTKWAKLSVNNYIFVSKLALALGNEFLFRFGKLYKSIEVVKFCLNDIPKNLPNITFSEPPVMKPLLYDNPNKILAHRNYYKHEKQHLIKYSKRNIPTWLCNNH